MSTKSEIIEFIAQKAEMTKATAEKAYAAFLDAITTSLKKGEPVVLVNFGTLLIRKRAARNGRNPRTGEEIKINAATVVAFKAGKALKEAVRDEK